MPNLVRCDRPECERAARTASLVEVGGKCDLCRRERERSCCPWHATGAATDSMCRPHRYYGPGSTSSLPMPDPDMALAELNAVREALGCKESDVVRWARQHREDCNAQRQVIATSKKLLEELSERHLDLLKALRVVRQLAESCPNGVPADALKLLLTQGPASFAPHEGTATDARDVPGDGSVRAPAAGDGRSG